MKFLSQVQKLIQKEIFDEGRNTGSDAKTMSIDIVIRDKSDVEQSYLAELFELKAKVGEVIMLGGHNNSEYFIAKKQKNLNIAIVISYQRLKQYYNENDHMQGS